MPNEVDQAQKADFNIKGILQSMTQDSLRSPEIVEKVGNQIRYNTGLLGIYIKQVVQLARLAHFCSPSCGIYVFNAELTRYNKNQFKILIQNAALNNLFSSDQIKLVKVKISGKNKEDTKKAQERVYFLEPGMVTGENKTYNYINLGRIPLLATFLDILIESLGYDTLMELLGPVLTDNPEENSANDVSNIIRNRFNEYLNGDDNIDTAHYIKKYSQIRRFLASKNNNIDPVDYNRVTDEDIIQFWRDQIWNGKAEGTGFVLFKSAAAGMLHYYVSRKVMEAEKAEERAYSIGANFEGGEVEASIPSANGNEGYLGFHNIQQDLIGGREWDSSAKVLKNASLDKIKWINDKDYIFIEDYAGHFNTGETLMGTAKYDLNFALTLLRVTIFNPIQGAEKQIDRLKNDVNDKSYKILIEQYKKVLNKLYKALCMSIKILNKDGCDCHTLLILRHFWGDDAIQPFINRDRLTDVPRLSHLSLNNSMVNEDLLTRFVNGEKITPELDKIYKDIKSAVCSRIGFTEEDQDRVIQETMSNGIEPAIQLAEELELLLKYLIDDISSKIISDKKFFLEVFEERYS